MLIALLAAAMAPPTLAATNFSVDEPMRPPRVLAWSDEFNGTKLDRRKWSFDTAFNKTGWFNEEEQYYAAGRPANVRLAEGRLIIEARRDPKAIRRFEDWGGQQYSSGKIMTIGKAEFRYGFVEARAKLPCTRGTWPAIWMMPVAKTQWPDGGEIDILEHVGSEPNVLHGTVHSKLFNHVLKTQRGAQKQLATACTEFHRYQMNWTPDAITIGVDDRAYMRVANDQPGGAGAWPFDQPFYLIINLAIGGPWASAKGMDAAALPQRLEVDYVRVWKSGD